MDETGGRAGVWWFELNLMEVDLLSGNTGGVRSHAHGARVVWQAREYGRWQWGRWLRQSHEVALHSWDECLFRSDTMITDERDPCAECLSGEHPVYT